MKRCADVDPVHRDAALGECMGVTSGPAPDVEHTHARFELERCDHEIDLLRACPS